MRKIARSSTAALARSVETGAPYDVEFRAVGADGALRWFHSRGLPERDPAGAVARMPGLILDTTARRAADADAGRRRRAPAHRHGGRAARHLCLARRGGPRLVGKRAGLSAVWPHAGGRHRSMPPTLARKSCTPTIARLSRSPWPRLSRRCAVLFPRPFFPQGRRAALDRVPWPDHPRRRRHAALDARHHGRYHRAEGGRCRAAPCSRHLPVARRGRALRRASGGCAVPPRAGEPRRAKGLCRGASRCSIATLPKSCASSGRSRLPPRRSTAIATRWRPASPSFPPTPRSSAPTSARWKVTIGGWSASTCPRAGTAWSATFTRRLSCAAPSGPCARAMPVSAQR